MKIFKNIAIFSLSSCNVYLYSAAAGQAPDDKLKQLVRDCSTLTSSADQVRNQLLLGPVQTFAYQPETESSSMPPAQKSSAMSSEQQIIKRDFGRPQRPEYSSSSYLDRQPRNNEELVRSRLKELPVEDTVSRLQVKVQLISDDVFNQLDQPVTSSILVKSLKEQIELDIADMMENIMFLDYDFGILEVLKICAFYQKNDKPNANHDRKMLTVLHRLFMQIESLKIQDPSLDFTEYELFCVELMKEVLREYSEVKIKKICDDFGHDFTTRLICHRIISSQIIDELKSHVEEQLLIMVQNQECMESDSIMYAVNIYGIVSFIDWLLTSKLWNTQKVLEFLEADFNSEHRTGMLHWYTILLYHMTFRPKRDFFYRDDLLNNNVWADIFYKILQNQSLHAGLKEEFLKHKNEILQWSTDDNMLVNLKLLVMSNFYTIEELLLIDKHVELFNAESLMKNFCKELCRAMPTTYANTMCRLIDEGQIDLKYYFWGDPYINCVDALPWLLNILATQDEGDDGDEFSNFNVCKLIIHRYPWELRSLIEEHNQDVLLATQYLAEVFQRLKNEDQGFVLLLEDREFGADHRRLEQVLNECNVFCNVS